MSLSLKQLMEEMTGKGGYNVAPKHSHLQDLKELLNDMIVVRDSGNCIGHSLTTYNGVLSLGDLNNQANQLKSCSCNINTNRTCNCQNRTGEGTCDCDYRQGCLCDTRTSAPTCSCYGRQNEVCYCHSRTSSTTISELNCSCNSVKNTSDSDQMCSLFIYPCGTYNISCSCQTDIIAPGEYRDQFSCSCYTVTSPVCECHGRSNEICDCQNRTGESACDCDYRQGCLCDTRTSSSACTCNGRCSCNTEQRFE